MDPRLSSFLFLAALLVHAAAAERLYLHDARYPITGCQYFGSTVPNVLGIFDVISTPSAILLQWIDSNRNIEGAGSCARINGNTAYPSETHEIKLRTSSSWNLHYAVDVVDGSFTSTNNRTYGQYSVLVPPGNQDYAISLSRRSYYPGWPDVTANATQRTYAMVFLELEWNGEIFAGVLSHEDEARNEPFDCTGHPTEIFEGQSDPDRPMHCPLGGNQTYFPRIRFDHPPSQRTIVEVPVPVPVPVPGPPANSTSCPTCDEGGPEDPVECARRAENGSALFLAGLQSKSPGVFVVAVIGCVLTLPLLVVVGILAIYVRKKRALFRGPRLNADDDYMIQLSEGSNKPEGDIRKKEGTLYHDDGTESSTPRARSETTTTSKEEKSSV